MILKHPNRGVFFASLLDHVTVEPNRKIGNPVSGMGTKLIRSGNTEYRALS